MQHFLDSLMTNKVSYPEKKTSYNSRSQIILKQLEKEKVIIDLSNGTLQRDITAFYEQLAIAYEWVYDKFPI